MNCRSEQWQIEANTLLTQQFEYLGTSFMTENSQSILDESLSALVDGEQNDIDLQRVLRSMDSGEEQGENATESVRETWSRYHMVGAIMRKDGSRDFQMNLSASVMAAIEEEQPTAASGGRLGSWWSGIGKTAVAASVTLGVVFAAQQFALDSGVEPGAESEIASSSEAAGGSFVDNEPSGAVVPQGFELPPLSAQTVSASATSPQRSASRPVLGSPSQGTIVVSREEFKEQMDRLMFKHAEQVSSSSALGVIPFARVSDARAFEAGEAEKAKEINTPVETEGVKEAR